MSIDNLLNEDWAIVGIIDPDAYGTGEQLTAAIDMSKWEQLCCVAMVGDLGASASVAVKLTSCDTSGGTYADITGKTTTVGGTSPNTGSNTQRIINLRSGEVPDNDRYIKASMTVGTAASDCGLIVLGKGRHKPAYDNDLASVTTIIN